MKVANGKIVMDILSKLKTIDEKIEELNGALENGFSVEIKPKLGTYKFEFKNLFIKNFDGNNIGVYSKVDSETLSLHLHLFNYRKRLIEERDTLIEELQPL